MKRNDDNSIHRTVVSAAAGGRVRSAAAFAFILSLLFSSSCTQLKEPAPEPFFAETAPPAVQELRWSNGKLPKSLDPARAAAPPETDVVRAIYEGLTELDPATLREVPAVAESWSATEGDKVWTFKLRKDARWSNGKPVTAADFVRAWKRLLDLGDKAAHRSLLANIVGAPRAESNVPAPDEADPLAGSYSNTSLPAQPIQRLAQEPATANNTLPVRPAPSDSNSAIPGSPAAGTVKFGVVADDDHTLRVTLVLPDKDFPKLVAHPIFRPIFSNGEEFVGKDLNPATVTNGPFRLARAEPTGLVLERSEQYWNRENVKLERVRMPAMESPENALAAYRAGELDAVTNTDFSSLVLKLLTPYEDFRRTTHSALNFYEVNSTKPPFSDRRVREALSSAIEREKLTETELDGSARPALNFLAFGTGARSKLTQDNERARELLEDAGFPDGAGFPVVKLVVNRNDTQQRVARAVARMWKQTLNIDTEIHVKEPAEIEQTRRSGEYDILRRGVVFPTSDETVNFIEVFNVPLDPVAAASEHGESRVGRSASPTPTAPPITREQPAASPSPGDPSSTPPADPPILTEEEALYQLRAIPLYFPTSYSLVKPYVAGFEMNSLDAIVLTNVVINNDWRPDGRSVQK